MGKFETQQKCPQPNLSTKCIFCEQFALATCLFALTMHIHNSFWMSNYVLSADMLIFAEQSIEIVWIANITHNSNIIFFGEECKFENNRPDNLFDEKEKKFHFSINENRGVQIFLILNFWSRWFRKYACGQAFHFHQYQHRTAKCIVFSLKVSSWNYIFYSDVSLLKHVFHILWRQMSLFSPSIDGKPENLLKMFRKPIVNINNNIPHMKPRNCWNCKASKKLRRIYAIDFQKLKIASFRVMKMLPLDFKVMRGFGCSFLWHFHNLGSKYFKYRAFGKFRIS